MSKTIDNLINTGKKVLMGIGLIGMVGLSSPSCITQATIYRPEAFEPHTYKNKIYKPSTPSQQEAIATLEKHLKKKCDDDLEITPNHFICKWTELPDSHGLGWGGQKILRIDYSKIKEIEVRCPFGSGCYLLFIEDGQTRWSASNKLNLKLEKEEYQKVIKAIYSLKR